jgi:hypothetical protein
MVPATPAGVVLSSCSSHFGSDKWVSSAYDSREHLYSGARTRGDIVEMNPRERFLAIAEFGKPDMVPVSGGPRKATLERWHDEACPGVLT